MNTRTFVKVTGIHLGKPQSWIELYALPTDAALDRSKENNYWLTNLMVESVPENNIYMIWARVLDDKHGNYAISSGPHRVKGFDRAVFEEEYSRMFDSKDSMEKYIRELRGNWK